LFSQQVLAIDGTSRDAPEGQCAHPSLASAIVNGTGNRHDPSVAGVATLSATTRASRMPSTAKEPGDIDSAPPAEDATLLRQAAHYACLVLAAMLGTLARLGLDAIGTCELS
jgi:hypothetical protein